MPGLLSVAGCGSGGAGGDEAARVVDPGTSGKGSVSLPLILRNYAGSTKTDTQVTGVCTGLTLATDRFGVRDGCVAFASGACSATFDTLPAAVNQHCVISLWLASESATTVEMTPLRLVDESGQETRFTCNGAVGGRLYREGPGGFDVRLGQPGEFTDGEWHNVVIQLGSTHASVGIDGAWTAASAATGLPVVPFRKLIIGSDVAAPWRGRIDDVRLHDKPLGDAEIAALTYRWSRVNDSNRADSTAGYYPFNGEARNWTGHGIDGIVRGTTLAPNRFGHADSAYSFDGRGAHIELDDSFDAVADEFALCFWMRTSSTAAMTALSVTASAEGSSLDVAFNDQSGVSVRLSGRSVVASGARGAFADDRWHFVVLQRSGDVLELFVDLESRGSVRFDGAIHGAGSRVRVGRGSEESTGSWSGQIDDLQVYVRTFAPAEMAALQTLQFRPKDGAGLLSFRDRLWLLGGWNSENIPVTDNEVWSSSDGQVWRFEGRAPWEGRHTAGWLVHDDAMWVLGGDRNLGHYQNEVWRSADGATWSLVTNSVPWADRVLFQVASHAGRMWLYGGMRVFESPQNQAKFSDVYSSSDGVSWTLETAAAPWSPRGMAMGAPTFKGRLWMVGGGSYDDRSYCNDVWSSGDGRNWERTTVAAPWTPRTYHGVVAFHGKLWVVGGATENNPGGQNDVWFSPDGSSWVELPDSPWAPRHAAGAVAHASRLWLVAGSSTRLFNDSWMLGFGE